MSACCSCNLIDLAALKTEHKAIVALQSLTEIEREFARLSPEAQLDVLERLVHCIRLSVSERKENWEPELSAMAADPEMRRELDRLEVEFGTTEGA